MLQTQIRGFVCRRRYLRLLEDKLRTKAAITIQKYIRRFLATSALICLRAELVAAIVIQKNFRMALAKRKLKRLKKQVKKRQDKEQRELTKRFEKQQKMEEEIEHLIENLYNKEVQERKSMAGTRRVK